MKVIDFGINLPSPSWGGVFLSRGRPFGDAGQGPRETRVRERGPLEINSNMATSMSWGCAHLVCGFKGIQSLHQKPVSQPKPTVTPTCYLFHGQVVPD